ncbi:MAG: DUF296 domain-containing protein [Candidatus Pacebacteria bacterium]|nr:DUF296 domain-containing protein [Candidatus Paceibacterota bacterium]
MQSKEIDNLIIARLFPDEDLQEKLQEICQKHKVKTAIILSGIGQLKNFKLGYFKNKGDYTPEFFSKPHEMISLSGIISKQGDNYEPHLHISLGDENKRVIGGHLIEGIVEITNEIVLLKSDILLRRKTEETTGLRGLFLEDDK